MSARRVPHIDTRPSNQPIGGRKNPNPEIQAGLPKPPTARQKRRARYAKQMKKANEDQKIVDYWTN